MSATAFTVTELGMTLVSDGATYLDGEIVTRDSPKVWKLNHSVALVWMGMRTNNISEIVSSVMGCHAKPAIHTIAAILEQGLSNNPAALAVLDDNKPYNIFTFECKPGYVDYWRLFYHEDRFTPTYKGQLKPGTNGALVVDTDDPPWNKLSHKYWQKHKKRFTTDAEAVEAVEATTREAFAEMVEMYQRENLPVGGKIFMETIRPQ